MSWTDEHGVVHEVGPSNTFTHCLTRIKQTGWGPCFDATARPTTCLMCLVFDLDTAMLDALIRMRDSGYNVDPQVLADLERKCNVHRP